MKDPTPSPSFQMIVQFSCFRSVLLLAMQSSVLDVIRFCRFIILVVSELFSQDGGGSGGGRY